MRRLLLLAALLPLAGCATIVDTVVADAISAPAGDVRARAGSVEMDPHVLMTRLAPAQRGDRARAEALAARVRAAIAPFQSVAAAEAAGYRAFPPTPTRDIAVVHYVNTGLSGKEAERIDPDHPGALLYEWDGDRLRLLGAMFTAPAGADLAEMDRRVPLSVTQWHLHQNVCVPRPLWDGDAWARRLASGAPVFGPESPIATEAACARERGRFLPTVFGWMAHLNVYARDPADTFNAMYGHGEHGAMPGGAMPGGAMPGGGMPGGGMPGMHHSH